MGNQRTNTQNESHQTLDQAVSGAVTTRQRGTNRGTTNQAGTNRGTTNQQGTNRGTTNQQGTNRGATNQAGTNRGTGSTTQQAQNLIGGSTQQGWAPAMKYIQDLLPYAMNWKSEPVYAPNDKYASGSPELHQLLQGIMGDKATMNPFMKGVVDPTVDRSNLEASLRGRSGSGAHAGWIAKNIGPLYQQEYGRMRQENLQRLGLGLQAGQMETGLEQNKLDDLTERHDYKYKAPWEHYNRVTDYYKNLAGLGVDNSGRTDTTTGTKTSQTESSFDQLMKSLTSSDRTSQTESSFDRTGQTESSFDRTGQTESSSDQTSQENTLKNLSQILHRNQMGLNAGTGPNAQGGMLGGLDAILGILFGGMG